MNIKKGNNSLGIDYLVNSYEIVLDDNGKIIERINMADNQKEIEGKTTYIYQN